jgi:UDP-N-acetylglucosamine 2-epimerase (non-hydrolysing)
VITDSGGVQEETSALGVRCFTLRDTTERPVTVDLGTNTVLGARPERIADIPGLAAEPKPGAPIPLWDGAAGERAAAAILEETG